MVDRDSATDVENESTTSIVRSVSLSSGTPGGGWKYSSPANTGVPSAAEYRSMYSVRIRMSSRGISTLSPRPRSARRTSSLVSSGRSSLNTAGPAAGVIRHSNCSASLIELLLSRPPQIHLPS